MKKLVLLSLLAGSMLASCAAEARIAVKPAADPLAGIIEDTDAHEEIFRKVSSVGLKNAMIDGDTSIKLGIQSQEHDGKIDIRFVAAIDTDGNFATTSARWTRHIYNDSGTEIKTVDNEDKDITQHTVNTGYTQVNNGGEELTVPDGYDHFVVYTIRNIPLAEASNYYITTFLELDYENDKTFDVESKVLATTVDQLTQFTFENDLISTPNCFGIKKKSTGFETVAISGDGSENYPNATYGNFAVFKNLELGNDEAFLVVRYTGSSFHVYGHQSVLWAGGNDYFQVSGTSNFVKPYLDLTCDYAISANTGDVGKAYISVLSAVKETTLYFVSGLDYWSGSSAKFALWYKPSASGEYKWSDFLSEGAVYGETSYHYFYISGLTLEAAATFNVVRFNSSAASPKWDYDNDVTWDQTGNVRYTGKGNLLTISEGTGWKDRGGSWSTYGA